MLERSADAFDWTFVGEWFSPGPGMKLSLATADQRPPPSPPEVVSWNPAKVSCNDCGKPNVDSVQANHVLEVTFSDQIHWGGGQVVLERGGLSTTLLDPVLDSRWFQVVGSRLRIVPPPQVLLGASSSCSRVRFEAEAVQNADGEFLVQGEPYSICIADTVAPKLMRTDPLDGASNQGLLPRILLEFDEEVTFHLNAAPVRLVPLGSSTAPTVTIQMTDTAKVRFTTCSYCALAGMVEIFISSQLEPETRYELTVPATSISDSSGNAWPGTVLSFTTECPATGCSTTQPPVLPTQTPGPTEPEDAKNIPIYLGIVGGVACCGAGLLTAWKYYARRYLLPRREANKEAMPPSSPTPAWTAQSGSVTTGWRKPQYTSSTAGPPGSVTISSPTSGSGNSSFGYGASRVTASTPNAGPRAASWAVPAQEQPRQPLRPPGAAGGPPPKQPSTQPPMAQDQRRAQTDEDVKTSTPKSPSAGAFKAAGRQASYTEENAVSGGWVKTTDTASGRTYWYHYKTRETRWDEPPRSGSTPNQGPPTPPRPKPRVAPEAGEPKAQGAEPKASGPSPQAGKRGQSKPEPAKAPPPAAKAAAPPPENTKAGRVKADILEQLQKTMKEDIASRKKTFRFLCLQWHPDKNQEDPELATEVFQQLQAHRDWYLKE